MGRAGAPAGPRRSLPPLPGFGYQPEGDVFGPGWSYSVLVLGPEVMGFLGSVSGLCRGSKTPSSPGSGSGSEVGPLRPEDGPSPPRLLLLLLPLWSEMGEEAQSD